MARKKSPAQLSQVAARLLQRLRRMEDADEDGWCTCVSCGKRQQWSDMDGGHYITRASARHRLSEWNVNPQCRGCNRFASSAKDGYTTFLLKKYGADFLADRIAEKALPFKWSREDLLTMIRDLKQRIAAQEKRLS